MRATTGLKRVAPNDKARTKGANLGDERGGSRGERPLVAAGHTL